MSFIINLLSKIKERAGSFFDESKTLTQEWLKKNLTLKNIILMSTTSGAITYAASSAYKFYLRKFSHSIEISMSDEAFYWILFWLKDQEYTSKTPFLSVVSGKPHSSVFRANQRTAKEKNKTDLTFVPSPGKHKLTFNGKTFYIQYDEVLSFQKTKEALSKKGQLILTVFGAENQDFLKNFINETQELFLKSFYGQTLIYVNTINDTFEPKISRAKRDPSTVVLENGFYDSLVEDAKNFLSKKQWYANHGIPFRRGYLLYGPPGTGKTSTILALAGTLDLNIAMVNLSSKELDDDGLYELLLNTPENSIILLEDIDHVLNSKNTEISFSGLLNSIDGVMAQEGRLLFCTTNNVLKLDEALLRPGRIDCVHELTYAKNEQIENMFLNFYPNSKDYASKFLKSVRGVGNDKPVTCATLQAHFLKFIDEPKKSVEHVEEIFMDKFESSKI
eukprot:gene803-9053_t